MNEQLAVYRVERGGSFPSHHAAFVEEAVFRRGHLIYSSAQHVAVEGPGKTTLSGG